MDMIEEQQDDLPREAPPSRSPMPPMPRIPPRPLDWPPGEGERPAGDGGARGAGQPAGRIGM